MSTTQHNPCAACSIEQDCCTHLAGLRLTESEFQVCFAEHQDLIDIVCEGPIYVVTPKHGEACPNWKHGGCAVYDVRPRECRLFPFTLFVRKQGDDLVSLGFHSDTNCPLKTLLKSTAAAAQEVVLDFGREAFPDARIEAAIESPLERWRRRAASVVGKLLAKLKP